MATSFSFIGRTHKWLCQDNLGYDVQLAASETSKNSARKKDWISRWSDYALLPRDWVSDSSPCEELGDTFGEFQRTTVSPGQAAHPQQAVGNRSLDHAASLYKSR